MKKNKESRSKSFSPIVAALLSILPHSFCCGIPMLLIAMGLGGLTSSAFLSRYHSLFIGIGVCSLAYGVYAYWRNFHASACTCCAHSKFSQRCSFCLLSLAMIIQVGMALYMWSPAIASPGAHQVVSVEAENEFAYQLTGLHCPGCAAEMEYHAQQMQGIESANILPSRDLLIVKAISTGINKASLASQLEALGYCEVRAIDQILQTPDTPLHQDETLSIVN